MPPWTSSRRRFPPTLTLALVLAAGAGLGVLVGGGGRSFETTSTATAPGGPQAARQARRDPVRTTLKSMSTERKVAQVFLWGFTGQGADASGLPDLSRLDLGGAAVTRAAYSDPVQLQALTGRLRSAASGSHHVRPWVVARQQGGEFNDLPGLPPATAPADLDSAQAGGREALAAGRQLRRLGVDGVLGPDLDVGPADNLAVGGRAYSDDPGEVAGYARAAIAGYRRAHAFSAPGHFPGLGAGSQPTEQGPADVGLSRRELSGNDLVPFRAAIDEGAPGILISNGLYVYDDFVTPGSLSRGVMVGVLRRQLHFKGIAVTDDLTAPAVTALMKPPAAAVQALRAGADMLFISGPPADQQASYRAVLRAVEKGRISRRRLDEAVRRILSVKRDYGLLR